MTFLNLPSNAKISLSNIESHPPKDLFFVIWGDPDPQIRTSGIFK
ncbi:hypothetical protein [Microcoleus sp.]